MNTLNLYHSPLDRLSELADVLERVELEEGDIAVHEGCDLCLRVISVPKDYEPSFWERLRSGTDKRPKKVQEVVQRILKDAASLVREQYVIDTLAAQRVQFWVERQDESCVRDVTGLPRLALIHLMEKVIQRNEDNLTHYEWANKNLSRLIGASRLEQLRILAEMPQPRS